MESTLLEKMKVVLHFMWDNTEVCNVEYMFCNFEIPLFGTSDEFSIYELLQYIKEDENYIDDYFVNNHNITMEEVDNKSPLEMALYYSCLFNNFTEYQVKVSSYDESLKFLEDIDKNLKDIIFENCDYDDGIILNVIREKITKAVNNTTLNVYFYLKTKELAIGELFEYIDEEVDIDNEFIQAACLFYHHFRRDLKDLSGEEIAYYLTECERYYLGDLFDGNPYNAVIDDETELVNWLNEGIYESTNILQYENNNRVFKLPSYLFGCNMDSEEIKIENETFFDNSNSPDIRISLGERILDNSNSPDISTSLGERNLDNNKSISTYTYDGSSSSINNQNPKVKLITKIKDTPKFNIYFSIYQRGLEIYNSRDLYDVVITDNELTAKYNGTANEPYEIKITNSYHGLEFSCTCPYYEKEGKICKHIAAFIIYIKTYYDFLVERIIAIDAEYEKNKSNS